MPLFLTLLSIVLFYFSPAEILPALAPYHIQQILIVPTVILSVVSLMIRHAGLAPPQWQLIIGLWFAVTLSRLSKFTVGQAYDAFMAFAIPVCIFCMVSATAFTIKRLRLIMAVQALCSLLMGIQGILAYHTGYLAEKLLLDNEGDIIRVRGFGILGDPNDFAQFLLIGLACLGIFWKRGSAVRNVVLLSVPAITLVYAISLTASRGAVFGLAVVMLVPASHVLGKFKAAALACGFILVGMLGLFTAGRTISLQEGSDRVVAWGTGISLLKSNPIFGVGWDNFTDFNSLTAHNSFVLCFAELGLFGYFFWLALLLTTIQGLQGAAKTAPKTPDDVNFVRVVTALRAALFGFVVTSWFLSRTYNGTLYILLGLGAAVIQYHRITYPGATPPPKSWIGLTLVAEFASILFVYLIIRVRTF